VEHLREIGRVGSGRCGQHVEHTGTAALGPLKFKVFHRHTASDCISPDRLLKASSSSCPGSDSDATDAITLLLLVHSTGMHTVTGTESHYIWVRLQTSESLLDRGLQVHHSKIFSSGGSASESNVKRSSSS
jgi:hypothetical protein